MLTLPRSNDGACLLPCELNGSLSAAAPEKLVEVVGVGVLSGGMSNFCTAKRAPMLWCCEREAGERAEVRARVGRQASGKGS